PISLGGCLQHGRGKRHLAGVVDAGARSEIDEKPAARSGVEERGYSPRSGGGGNKKKGWASVDTPVHVRLKHDLVRVVKWMGTRIRDAGTTQERDRPTRRRVLVSRSDELHQARRLTPKKHSKAALTPGQ